MVDKREGEPTNTEWRRNVARWKVRKSDALC